jgi:hypothetical protein
MNLVVQSVYLFMGSKLAHVFKSNMLKFELQKTEFNIVFHT